MSLLSVFTCRDKSMFCTIMLSLYRISSVRVTHGRGVVPELVSSRCNKLEWLTVMSHITQLLCYYAGTNPTVMEVQLLHYLNMYLFVLTFKLL